MTVAQAMLASLGPVPLPLSCACHDPVMQDRTVMSGQHARASNLQSLLAGTGHSHPGPWLAWLDYKRLGLTGPDVPAWYNLSSYQASEPWPCLRLGVPSYRSFSPMCL